MKRNEEAASTTLAFIVAAGILMGSIMAVFTATNDLASDSIVRETDQINLQSEAKSLKDLVLFSPGVYSVGGSNYAWGDDVYGDADDLVRLGLADPETGLLQFEKLQNLRLAPYAANATDGYVNYEETREALGLASSGLDFHIRAKPALKSVEEVLTGSAPKDPNLLVTYLGNVTEVSSDADPPPIDDGLVLSDVTCSASPTGSPSHRLTFHITNGGSTATQFFFVLDITNGKAKIDAQGQTGVVASEQEVEFAIDFSNTETTDCDEGTQVSVEVWDPSQLLRTEVLVPTSGVAPDDTETEFMMETDRVYYLTSSGTNLLPVVLNYFGDMENGDDLALTVREGSDLAGTIAYQNLTATVAKNSKDQFLTIPAGTLSAGNYTAYVTVDHDGDSITSVQNIIVLDADPDTYQPMDASGTTNLEEDPAVAVEVAYLEKLVERFCPTYYNSTVVSPIATTWGTRCSFRDVAGVDAQGEAQYGDVFGDVQDHVESLLKRIQYDNGTPRYDIVNTLVVGSNVAHNAMTKGWFKWPLQNWVYGGGTLVVFGSPSQSTQWLRPVFDVGQTSSSGGISTPDSSHPMLNSPDALAFYDYDTFGKGWDYIGSSTDRFTNVVVEGNVPVTAISDPGAYDKGTIILSSWLPYDLYGQGADTSGDEGLKLMQNFIVQGYRDLFLDYGPPLPHGVDKIPELGIAQVVHPDLGHVTLYVEFYVFPSA